MKTRILNTSLVATLLAAAGAAQADPGRYGPDGFVTRARVISSTPIYDTISEPRRECWTETVGYETRSYRDGNGGGGAILGAIAGGLLGSTVGKGDGRVAAAAVGAATGAVVGDRWNGGGTRYEETRPRQVERCRVRDDYRQVVSGYDVRYRFQGRVYATQLPYDPGRWLTLDGNFAVSDGPRDARWRDPDDNWND
ncbi:MAG: glycine zipper 2TM domain-containing protein [Betaproteobacteria bacterium]|nr:glycine zipper 2TM domain-containing protein [Betaproteobacteria bacterium]